MWHEEMSRGDMWHETCGTITCHDGGIVDGDGVVTCGMMMW